MRISDWSSDVCSSDLAEQGTAVFRLREHTNRLFRSAHILQMAMPYDKETLIQAQLDVVRDNRLESAYIRDRKSVGKGKSVSVSVDFGGRRIITKKKKKITTIK